MRRTSVCIASRAIDWWPWRQTKNVRAFATAEGNGYVATPDAAAELTRITERGTMAIPDPAATHATMAWYEPNSMTRSGTTLAAPSHDSSRRRYEQPVAKAMSVVRPMSRGVLILGKLLGVIRTSSSQNTGSPSRSSAANGSATNAASISWFRTLASRAPVGVEDLCLVVVRIARGQRLEGTGAIELARALGSIRPVFVVGGDGLEIVALSGRLRADLPAPIDRRLRALGPLRRRADAGHAPRRDRAGRIPGQDLQESFLGLGIPERVEHRDRALEAILHRGAARVLEVDLAELSLDWTEELPLQDV